MFLDCLCHSQSYVSQLRVLSPPEVFLGKSVLKIRSKFTGEHLYRSVIIKIGNKISVIKIQYLEKSKFILIDILPKVW